MVARPDDQSAEQERVLAFLGDPGTHGGATVRRIDTHASSVFLAGGRALKVKRAVRLPYLDYSSLALRKGACEAELAINRPNAPQLYRRVVAVVRNENGRLAIGGTGAPVEWALEMARFDEAKTLDKITRQQDITTDLATEIADAIIDSHQRAEPSSARWSESLPTLITRNTERFRSARVLTKDRIDHLEASSLASFERVKEPLAKRCVDGFVRRCHGDLHLANLALIDGHPVLFDAIEFDPAMATTDVLYDLAFPVMDLLHFKRHAAANTVLNRYLTRTSEANLDALCALPLFLSVRAAVRANVLTTQTERGANPKIHDRALDYFALAERLIAPEPARLIAIGGYSGTGKSALARTLACEIAPAPGAVILRSDVLRKAMFGVDELAPLRAEAYQPEVSGRVYDRLASAAKRILAQGFSVIVDAAYLRESERDAIAKTARDCKVRFDGLFLNADLATRLQRIATRAKDASDANAEVAKLQQHYDIGALKNWTSIDASGSAKQTLAASLRIAGRLSCYCRKQTSLTHLNGARNTAV